MTIRRPLGELDLDDPVRLQSHAVFHLFLGQGHYVDGKNRQHFVLPTNVSVR